MKSSTNLALAISMAATSVYAGPCDIYAAGDTPCVAAHSTTRALYDAYNGALYQVTRNSDNSTIDVAPLRAGGVANAATQDNFCAGSTCLISIIYDQSGMGNHLSRALKGYWSGPSDNGNDDLAGATGAPVTLNGQNAYGVFISPGTGYRNDNTNGIATGDEPEGIYAVLDSNHFNDGCCFDYGNAEVSGTDTGAAHMEAVYFGNCASWGYGEGSGPWVMADLENGLYSGQDAGYNADPTADWSFVTGIVKGNNNNTWAIRSGNAQSGSLQTDYNGPRPNGYSPMHKEGAILLGIGGDNSNSGQGTFYEGVMTSGYPSDATEEQVQENIVAAGYATRSPVSGPALSQGSTVTFRVTTPGYDTRYIAHDGSTVNTQVITSSSSSATQQSGSWVVQAGLADSACFTFESVDTPGSFIRHYGFHLQINSNDNSKQFGEDATFCPESGLNGQGNTMRSWSYPTRNWRHYGNVLYAASQGGVDAFDNPTSYQNDVSFVVSTDGFES